jgi:drug/metabolite transporter (DMT)-like permease
MSTVALTLVVIGSFIHAYWNLLVKRAAGGAAFVWLFSLASAVLYAPIVLVLLIVDPPSHYGAMHWLLIAISGALHLLYAITLSRGYKVADLSVVYPIARGTGPLLSCLVAITVLGERPSTTGWAGIVLIVAGVFLIAAAGGISSHAADGGRRRAQGVFYGGLTGACIAAYTINDAYAVKFLLVSPILLDYFGNFIRLIFLTPNVLTAQSALREQWRINGRMGLMVGALMPLSYILALFAMQLAPVSYVAPARELSMLIGAIFGAKLLHEGNTTQRILGTLLMIAGIIGLSLA